MTASASIEKKTFIGKIDVYYKEYGAPGGFAFLGNMESLTQAYEQNQLTVPDNTRASSGGEWDALSRITNATASGVLLDRSNEVFAMLNQGKLVTSASAVVADEVIAVIAGDALYPTAKVVDTTETVTVTGPSGTPVYTAGTDYIVKPSGIRKLGTGTIAAGNIEVSYTSLATTKGQLINDTAKEYVIKIDGYNEASGKAFVGTYHRCRINPTTDQPYVGEDFSRFPVELRLLKDPNITGSDLSQTGEVQFQD